MAKKDGGNQLDLLGGAIRQRGRPTTGQAKTGSQRQAAFRERLRREGLGQLTVSLPLELLHGLDKFIRFKGISKDVVIERLLRHQLLRKR